MQLKWIPLIALFLLGMSLNVWASDEKEGGHDRIDSQEEYIDQVMHHVQNANEIHLVGDFSIPLPVILYNQEQGFTFTMSSAFDHGHKAVDGYVLFHGRVHRVMGDFPRNEKVKVGHITHHEGEEGESAFGTVEYKGKEFRLEPPSAFMEMTSFVDLSITKNVFTMILALLLMYWLFGTTARSMERREGKAPKGIQSFMEPFIVFIRDDVAKPIIGENYERYLPFIMSLFFFILVLNLLGLVPFIGGPNVTGNASTTLCLALFTFFLVIFISKRDYWAHMLWMPGVPVLIKIVLAIIELISLIIKPVTLFIRLGANITAGHIAILAMVGLIFMFSDFGQSLGGGITGAVIAIPFTFFMNLLEIFVAVLQAFIFALLSAMYIGEAIEEHH